jgi:hypothetical protein
MGAMNFCVLTWPHYIFSRKTYVKDDARLNPQVCAGGVELPEEKPGLDGLITFFSGKPTLRKVTMTSTSRKLIV